MSSLLMMKVRYDYCYGNSSYYGNTIDILVVDVFQEDNVSMASLLQDLLSQEKPSLPGIVWLL